MRWVRLAMVLLLAALPARAEPVPIKVIPYDPSQPVSAQPSAGPTAPPPAAPVSGLPWDEPDEFSTGEDDED
jgi:hypothetical protein